ncbi:MAG: hypothetical protein IPP78_13010 [Holophagaceae bacterium]|nr:hypothetical protein [Holophagaceae bacterium]
MRLATTCFALAALLLPMPAFSAPQSKSKSRSKAPKTSQAIASLQAQVKRLTAEREDLSAKLQAAQVPQEDLAAALKSRDLAKEEASSIRKELDQLKSSLKENQQGGDSILNDLQHAKESLKSAQEENLKLKADLVAANAKLAGKQGEGALLPITPDVNPARPINLNQVRPKAKKVDKGVVVVNVLVNESGEVLATKLLQGLPGTGEWVDKANDACVEAAKRLVFEPATAGESRTRIRVWQGVGFLLD